MPALKLGGVTIESLLQDEAGITTGSLYALLTSAILLCVSEGILAKCAARYFTRELADGTPFTTGGAQQLQTTGILAVCLPLGAQILTEIVTSILEKQFPDTVASGLHDYGSIAVGVTLIVVAQICKYGAALLNEKAEPAEEDV